MNIDGWTITIERGCGGPPEFREMDFYCVIGPHVKTETRVDGDGLKMILPPHVYAKYSEGLQDA